MAEEALRLKVDKDIYQQTLNSLDSKLGQLKSYKDNLDSQIGRLKNGNVFSGSDVKSTIIKGEEALEKVKDAISRVTGYREAIQQQLSGTEGASTQLASDISSIDLPNMFN